MMQNKILGFLFINFISGLSFAQTYPDLLYQETGSINLFYSHKTEVNPIFLGEMTDEANDYFTKILGDLDMQVNVLVLNPADWIKHAIPNLIYGMPHFKASENAIVIASDDNDFWRMQMPDVSQLNSPHMELMTQTYTMKDGSLSNRYFFDLLAIHELAHLWSNRGKRAMQRLWLEEIFANLALHTFIDQERNEWLSTLEVLPSYHATRDGVPMQYTTLEGFESDYIKIGMEAPHNYGWYQYRFHHAARHIFNEGGPEVVIKLWDFLDSYQGKLSDKDLIKKLEEGSTSLF